MAHKKATGSTALGRDSRPKRLGVKITDGEAAHAGQIIIRQRGTSYHAGKNVKRAGDDSLYALLDGIVRFKKRKTLTFVGALASRVYVTVEPKIAS